MAEELLKVQNISKTFGGVKALDDVSITIDQGEIHCLVGENGSGKSTLIKVISGVYEPDGGEIIIIGTHYKRLHPIEAIHEGIQVIYQDFSLFPNLTVAENIALNYQLAKNKQFVNWREIRQFAKIALDKIKVHINLDVRIEQLSVADKQLVAISRALLQNARLIIMDEPTTALTNREVKSLFSVITNLQKDGISTLFVSHKLNEILEISQRTMVMRNGKKVIDADASEFNSDKLVYYMTGHQIEDVSYKYSKKSETSLLKVEELTSGGNFEQISFELMPGEILGITGLLGCGRTELALALFGVQPIDGGTLSINGQPVKIENIQDAVNHGIGYVPEDRITEGLFLEQSIGRNIAVCTLRDILNTIGFIDNNKLDSHINRWVKNLNIKTPSHELAVKTLSGGNQQRVVLAKWLASAPKVLILNGPTVGVDIGSKSELHEIIRNLAEEGMGVIIISDDIPELLHTCNRILLMKKGRMVDEFQSEEITENELAAKLTEE